MSNYCQNCYELAEENERLKEEIERIGDMRVCYENNLKLCKWQEQQINKLATKLEKILDFCKTLEDVKEEYMRIQLIKEIIEDKKDIHYYLEQGEVLKDYYDSLPPCCNIDDTFCESNKDCYYRQLKRLEAENTKLKAKLEKMNKLGKGEQTELSKYARNLEDKLAKCEQKLKKIKELIQYCQSVTFCYECKYNSTCMGKFNFIEHILSIIEGVEDENI